MTPKLSKELAHLTLSVQLICCDLHALNPKFSCNSVVLLELSAALGHQQALKPLKGGFLAMLMLCSEITESHRITEL